MSEGFLSSFYHVCPTKKNFQFDTTFMYVICALMTIKIYQFRHPDRSSNAYKIFFGLSIIVLLEVLGIYYQSTIFWAIFTIMYLLILIKLSPILYKSGKWKRPWQDLNMECIVSQ